jgi:CRP-like cAMP-binding protein
MESSLSQTELCGKLEQSLLFSSLSQDQLLQVCKHSKNIKLSDGETLFSKGDAFEHFYMVLSGTIKLYLLSPEGQEKIVEIMHPGHTFAEALMFLDHPQYPVYSSAITDTELVSIDAREFARMLRESTDTCFALMGNMSKRLHNLIREIDDLSLHTGTCRVASYLLKQAPDNSNHVKLDIPKGVIAARLSVKPETFSRIIKNLTQQNIITVHGSKVTIHDRIALSAIADI